MSWSEQIKLAKATKLPGSDSLYIGSISELAQTGFSDNPFAMNQSDYRKSKRKKANNPNYSKHGVSDDFFDNLPDRLKEACLFVDNGTKVTVITDKMMKDKNNKDSYVIAGVWRDQQMENDTVNLIKSAYPLDDFVEHITNYAETGKLVVTNKNKAEKMLTTMGIQTSEVSRLLNLAKGSICGYGELQQDSET